MNYYIMINTPGKYGKYKDEISETKYQDICAMIVYLSLVRGGIDQYRMVQIGIENFIKQSPLHCWHTEDDYAHLNFYFSAWINAFYCWLEFNEKNFSDIFKKVKSKYYDSCYSYRLAYNLRIASTHHGGVIDTLLYDTLCGKTTICISCSTLMKCKSYLQNRFVRELDAKGKEHKNIDAVKLSAEMSDIIQAMQFEIWDACKEELCKKIKYLMEILPADMQDMYNSSLESEDGKVNLQIGLIVTQFINRANCNIPHFREELHD